MVLSSLIDSFAPLVDALSLDPQLTMKTGLRIVHFIGLALGVGAATVLDLMILRFLVKEKVTEENWRIFQFGSKIVNAGLVILWLTGLGFLAYYSAFDPGKLANEKIWAKLVIVSILTLNGVFIHAVALPLIQRRIGARLLSGLSWRRRSALLVAGSISAVSWYVPLALGALPQLNFAVPMITILMTYALILSLAIGTALLVGMAANRMATPAPALA